MYWIAPMAGAAAAFVPATRRAPGPPPSPPPKPRAAISIYPPPPPPPPPRGRGWVCRFPPPRLRRRVGRGILGWQWAASTLSIVLVAGACGMPAQFGFSGPDNRTDSSSVDLISALSTGALTGADLAVASAATTTLLDYRDGRPCENPD